VQRCREENVWYCVAPYEADPQLAFMVASGLADFVITEDSDLLAYGCPHTLFKLRLSGTCQSVHLSRILESLRISKEEFTDLCILAGCDYCKLPGVGINKAHAILNAAAKKEEDCINYVEQMFTEKVEIYAYKKKFLVARDCFAHAIVFDVCSLEVSRLNKHESNHTCCHEYGKYPLVLSDDTAGYFYTHHATVFYFHLKLPVKHKV
jgi:exonuclease-1